MARQGEVLPLAEGEPVVQSTILEGIASEPSNGARAVAIKVILHSYIYIYN